MKVLITGATGLIGSQIIKDALNQGIEVNFLTTKRIKTVKENKLKSKTDNLYCKTLSLDPVQP